MGDHESFEAELLDPKTPARRVGELVATTPAATALAAQHPNAYPELLQWIAQHGDPQSQEVARFRLADLTAPTEQAIIESSLTPTALPEPAAMQLTASPMPSARRWFARPAGIAAITAAALAVAGGGIAIASAVGSTPEASTIAESEPEPDPTPTTYPIPDGCPSAAEFGAAWIDEPDWADSLDASSLVGELASTIPEGGCAFARREVGTAASSSSTYRYVQVWYFNLDTPGRLTAEQLLDWAASVGGTPSPVIDPLTEEPTGEYSDHAVDLPVEFSAWTGSDVSVADGESVDFGWYDGVIPGFTQGSNGRIEFALNSERVDALVAASGQESLGDPTLLLSQGLATSFSTSFSMSDAEGYSMRVEITGRLQPFSSEVADSPPGKFRAESSAAVSGSVTNTTAGRNAESTGVSVVALYPIDAEACQGLGEISVEGGDWGDPSYCFVRLGGLPAAELAPDATQQVPADTQPIDLGEYAEDGAALAQLNAPVAVYAYFGGKGVGLSGVAWTADHGCHVPTGSGGQWVVAMAGWADPLCG